jgi:hypothetical protein
VGNKRNSWKVLGPGAMWMCYAGWLALAAAAAGLYAIVTRSARGSLTYNRTWQLKNTRTSCTRAVG